MGKGTVLLQCLFYFLCEGDESEIFFVTFLLKFKELGIVI